MQKILFVCHGNICRSPMAQYLLAHLAAERGLACRTQSAATSREEIGNPIYPPARRKLREKGIPFGDHRAVQMTRQDYGAYDLLLAMDQAQCTQHDGHRRVGPPQGRSAACWTSPITPGTLPTPWYTGDFEATYDDLLQGCQALLDWLEGQDPPCV